MASEAPRAPVREKDALYQKDRIVARVLDAHVDESAKQIHFGEIYQSDSLLIPDPCEYQKFVIQIQTIDYATKIDREAVQKGRILRGVTADIVGYREQ